MPAEEIPTIAASTRKHRITSRKLGPTTSERRMKMSEISAQNTIKRPLAMYNWTVDLGPLDVFWS